MFNQTLLETEPSDPFQANSVAENLLLSSGARMIHRPDDEAFTTRSGISSNCRQKHHFTMKAGTTPPHCTS